MTIPTAEAPTIEGARDEAWALVVALERQSGQRLYGYARHLGVDGARSADLVQEALIRLWRELGRGTPIVSPEAWAYRTVARLAADEHRLHRRIARLVGRLGEREAAPPAAYDAADRIAVWTQVDRLPSRQRQVVYLRYKADLPFSEIAAILAISEPAARSHASQAVATLRAHLSDEGR
jgi:RNA polymerase sigma-70 factor (ECF subfamily)